MPAKRKYVVPILKPEHCTEEYMLRVGLREHDIKLFHPAAVWADHAFGCDNDFWDAFLRISGGDLYSSKYAARQFNRAVLSIDPNAKPTGKPYPLKKGKVR